MFETMPRDYVYRPWPWEAIDAKVGLAQRLQVLAHREKDCPVCVELRDIKKMPFPWPMCSTCGGIGKVFVFGYMVRVRCRYPDCHKGQQLNKNGVPEGDCANCRGRGTVASQDGMVWIKALEEWDGYSVHFSKGRCRVDYPDNPTPFVGEGPDLFEALIAALEKAVVKEKDD